MLIICFKRVYLIFDYKKIIKRLLLQFTRNGPAKTHTDNLQNRSAAHAVAGISIKRSAFQQRQRGRGRL